MLGFGCWFKANFGVGLDSRIALDVGIQLLVVLLFVVGLLRRLLTFVGCFTL